jgi:hypothetical protein
MTVTLLIIRVNYVISHVFSLCVFLHPNTPCIVKSLSCCCVASGTVPTVAAVAIVSGNSRQKGVVRFVASDDEVCIIDGTVDGLQPGVQYSLRVHEYGDLSGGCDR